MAELPHRHIALGTAESPLPALAARCRQTTLATGGRAVAALTRLAGRHPAGWRWLA
ncbi:phenylacetate--CoA ligase family protein, partial [Verrucosispora sp. SN26_14.1]